MRWEALRRLAAGSAPAALCAVLLATSVASATCASTGAPTYDDVTKIYVRQYYAAGPDHRLKFELSLEETGSYADAYLHVLQTGSMPIGYYEVPDAHALLASVRALLRLHGFYDLKPTNSNLDHLAPPQITVGAGRCGMVTVLKTVDDTWHLDPGNPTAEALYSLTADIEGLVTSRLWEPISPGEVPYNAFWVI